MVVVIWEGKEVRVIVFDIWNVFERVFGVFCFHFRVGWRWRGSFSGRMNGRRGVFGLEAILLVERFVFLG